MDPTVSGNGITIDNDPETGKNDKPEKPETSDKMHAEKETVLQEPVTNNYTYETYETYEIDNSEVCQILNELLSESQKANESLGRIADSLDVMNETITVEPEEMESEDSLPEETEETVSGNDALFDILESMEETFAGIQETGTSIYDTVSGNTLYLEDISNNSQELIEYYTEATEKHEHTLAYGIATEICILIAAGIIAGLNIAKLVWGKMR